VDVPSKALASDRVVLGRAAEARGTVTGDRVTSGGSAVVESRRSNRTGPPTQAEKGHSPAGTNHSLGHFGGSFGLAGLEHAACSLRHEAWKGHGGAVGDGDDLPTSSLAYHQKLCKNRPICFPLSSTKKSHVAFVSRHRQRGGRSRQHCGSSSSAGRMRTGSRPSSQPASKMWVACLSLARTRFQPVTRLGSGGIGKAVLT
jgi:hypothetical protein